MKRPRFRGNSAPVLQPGQFEYEFGVPIAGPILEKALWASTALKRLPETLPADWTKIFGRSAPIVLDIGCGNGRYTIASAVDRPECNHLAVDFLPAVIRYGTRRANQRGLGNTRFAVSDGWRILHDYFASNTIAEIHIYHPQPYADPNEANLRMLTPDFIALVHDRLETGGQVILQTDRASYWEYISTAISPLFDWHPVAGEWPSGPQFRSRREILARKQGLPIHRGWGVKREGLTREDIQSIVGALPQPAFEVEE